jgi:Fic family protein
MIRQSPSRRLAGPSHPRDSDRVLAQGIFCPSHSEYDMAASAAKYAHCQVTPPVEYRGKLPFHPEIAAPLDFTLRMAEVYALDRELDRAVLGVKEYVELLTEDAQAQIGPGGVFLTDLESRPRQREATARKDGGVALGPVRRQYILNQLRFVGESARFRPPWTPVLIQDAHALLMHDLGLGVRPGALRTDAYTGCGPDGQAVYTACPPERVVGELQSLLEWVDRVGPTLSPIVPAIVLLQGFHSIRPFPVGNMSVASTLALFYLRLFGLPNSTLVPVADAMLERPAQLLRLLLWSEASGSYTELLDYATDAFLQAYAAGTVRWLHRRASPRGLEETALRLLARARRVTGWFSSRDAARWVGGRSEQTVARHLNALVRSGAIETLGQTRGKRYRRISTLAILPRLQKRFSAPAGTKEGSSEGEAQLADEVDLSESRPSGSRR